MALICCFKSTVLYLDTSTVHFYHSQLDQLLHNINILITYNYIWFAPTCFDVNTSSSGSSSCMAKITQIVDLDKMELLKYKIWNTKYKMIIVYLYSLYIHPPRKDLIVRYKPTSYERLFYTLYFILYILTIPFYQDQQSM